MPRTAIIGAGAAGCFCAIELRRRLPEMEVCVFEAGPKALAKVAITGGGRCNLTNSFEQVGRLEEVYPRGSRVMSRAFRSFDNFATMEWFEHHGVALTTQDDCCVFPVSQDAMQIVRTLENLMRRGGVELRLNTKVEHIVRSPEVFLVDGEPFDKVVVTTGGGALKLLEDLDLEIEKPVPSLFTFRIDDAPLRSLMGTVVDDVCLSLAGTKFRSQGILLITDWGVSGPATLKLSSYAARHLADNGYTGDLLVNWSGSDENEVRAWISKTASDNARKQISSVSPKEFTSRLWKHLTARAGLRETQTWAELGSKGANRLAAVMTADSYHITGRCRFKDEFVTCGGVALSNVNLNTLESRKYPGLHFAGEVLDIDAVTGGFNLQAAWSTGWTVASSISLTEPGKE